MNVARLMRVPASGSHTQAGMAVHAHVVRRAAFDIGSGCTKLLVVDVDTKARRITGELYGEERRVPFKAGAASSGGSLPPDVMRLGIEVLTDLVQVAKSHGAQEFSGVATEVFRHAGNGGDFLKRVQHELGFSVSIVAQKTEAMLGLATAEAYAGAGVTSWDSGGGSFQIAKAGPTASATTPEMMMYAGRLGTVPACEILSAEILGKPFVSASSGAPGVFAPNPVSFEDAERLVTLLTKRLDPVPEWLAGCKVVAIGGDNSLFAVALRSLGRDPRVPGLIERSDLDALLGSVTEKTDEALRCVSGFHRESDNPATVVPKLALMVALARHLNFQQVSFQPTIGSCAGLAVSDEYYQTA